jgi:uncharacterized membrane protein HdeD (DUF308 family)
MQDPRTRPTSVRPVDGKRRGIDRSRGTGNRFRFGRAPICNLCPRQNVADVPTTAALFLASYPLIDAIASVLGSTFADARVLRINAAVSALAVVWIAIAGFGSDTGATLVAFGAWAAVSGAIQLGIAIHHRRAQGRQLPMIVSGAVSTIAGVSFIAASGDDNAHLATLAGYMAVGALLFLLWARRSQADPQEAR